MVTVLGPIELLEKCVKDAVEECSGLYDIKLRVVINGICSLEKLIKNNYNLPRRVRVHAIGNREVAVQRERVRLGLFKQYETVVALVYPFREDCVVIVDERYGELGKNIESKISEIEKKTPEFWFM